MYGIKYKVKTDLLTEPVDELFFKEHARIDFNVDQNLLPTYLKAARQYLEQYTQKSFGEKTMVFSALEMPTDYELMFGPVASLGTTSDANDTVFTHFGDIVREGGKEVTIEYITEGVINDVIKVAICRYAAGLYAIRENVTYNDNGNPVNGEQIQDEAKKMVRPYGHITLF